MAACYAVIALLFIPLSLFLRFYFLSNPILEPHPWRQTQTALTIVHLYKGTINWLNYQSPFDGKLWKFVFEFPLYQWIVALVMKLGLSLEVASRLVTLDFFLAGWVVFGVILYRVWGKQVALWGGLFYFISPFNVIYSRVCLVDFTAVFLVLLTFLGTIEFLRDRQKTSWRWLLTTLVAGSLAAVIKVNIWYIPAGFLGSYSLWNFFRNRERRWSYFYVGFVFAIQLLSAMLWIYYTHRFTDSTHIHAHNQWLFGPLVDRLNLWQWKKILDWILRGVFHDWMVVPALFMLLWVWTRPYLKLLLVGLALIPIAVMFNVHTYHDYYLISVMPYLMAMAGWGMAEILRLPKYRLAVWLGATLVVCVWKFYKLPYQYTTIFHDYREELKSAETLKRLTSPNDIIYVDKNLGQYQLAIYSDRLVALGDAEPNLRGATPSPKDPLDPTVFLLVPGDERFDLLDPYEMIWIDPLTELMLYRVAGSGEFGWSRQKILLTDEPISMASVPLDVSKPTEINLCLNEKGSAFSLSGRGVLELSFEGSRPILLPIRKTLFLPAEVSPNCRAILSRHPG